MSKVINSSQVRISGYSCVTPFGLEPEDLWTACEKGARQFEKGLCAIPESLSLSCQENLQNKPTGQNYFKGSETNALLNWSLHSIERAISQSGFEKVDDRTGLIIATTTGLTALWENELMNYFRDQKVKGHVYQPLGSFALELQNRLGHHGPVSTLSSACSAGTQALGMGKSWIEMGYVDRCVVLGAEQLCQLTDRGFRALSLVSGEDSRPFNNEFSNICLSEAAAVICLERSEAPGVYLSGYGCTSDAYSMTSPKPDGSGPARAMKEALVGAGLMANDVDWVHAHGTGSKQNDEAEVAAIQTLEITAPVTSSKGVHGHSLAASGVLESVLCCMAIKKQMILPTIGSSSEDQGVQVCREAKSMAVKHILKNSLGFGGINATLILSQLGGSDA